MFVLFQSSLLETLPKIEGNDNKYTKHLYRFLLIQHIVLYLSYCICFLV